jgi:ribosome biogenesis protein SSF1/2
LNREKSTEDDGSFILNFRHYAITTRATGISKPLKRLNAAERLLASKKSRKGGVPNLGKLEDIADYMIGGEGGEGYMTDGTSGSEIDTDAEVEILDTAPRKVTSGKPRAPPAEDDAVADDDDGNVERRAVKLVELGPRMRLRLTKVEEGLCSGKTMWHEHIHKTKEEVQELEKRWAQRRQEKEARRKQQRENVEKKRRAQAKGDDGDEDEMDIDDEDEFDSEGLEGDAEYQVNEELENEGEWEDEEMEIAKG